MKRFGDLSRGVPGISPKMLTQQSRQTGEDNLVSRTVSAEARPRVEYSLAVTRRSASHIPYAMHK